MEITRCEFIRAIGATAVIAAVPIVPHTSFGESRQIANDSRKEGSGMLKGISPAISPDLLKTLAEMGHGDEIVISDAHFPGHTFNPRVIRADGIGADRLLSGIIPLFELDAYATPIVMMAAVPGDTLDPSVEAKYRKALGYSGTIERVERFAFYERAKKSYAVVISGETAKYGNIILKKGVTPAFGD
jgi:L-fucose mutarotase